MHCTVSWIVLSCPTLVTVRFADVYICMEREGIPQEAEPLGGRIKPTAVLLEHRGVLERRAVQPLTVFAVTELGL